MTVGTDVSVRLRAMLLAQRAEIEAVLHRYSASNLRVFGSVARGEATEASDLDLLVDLDSDVGNSLLQVAGIAEELSEILGVRVDVVTGPLLRDGVSATALADAVAV